MASTNSAPIPFGPFRALASNILQRVGLASKAGLTFTGARDLYAALGYKRDLSPADYRDRYERNAVAGRIVEAMPKATWRGGGELVENEDADTLTPFEEAWFALADRLHIWPTLARADILAGLGRYAVVLIGGPGKNLEAPLERVRRPEDLAFLIPFSEQDAPIEERDWVTDTEDPRFGQPAFYTLSRLDPGPLNRPRRVHYTRILHIADGLLDDLVFGQPRLKRCWNLLDDLEKVTGGGAEAYWLRAHQGTQVDVDPGVEMGTDDWDKLQEQVDEYIHNLRRTMQTRGVTMKSLGSDVSTFETNADAILMQISAGTGIPHRILTGSERGELASSQDKNNWNERIADRRLEFAEAQVVRPLVDRLIALGALPKPIEYTVRWPEVKNLDDMERMQLAESAAKVNQAQGEIVIEVNEIRDRYLGLPPLEQLDADLEDAPGDGAGEEIVEADAPTEADVEDEARAAAAKKKRRLSLVPRTAIAARSRAS